MSHVYLDKNMHKCFRMHILITLVDGRHARLRGRKAKCWRREKFCSSKWCPHGMIRNPQGCPLRGCPCDNRGSIRCDYGQCAAKFCLGGLRRDIYGCPLPGCPCNGENVCPPVGLCSLTCPLQTDWRGCKRCRCRKLSYLTDQLQPG